MAMAPFMLPFVFGQEAEPDFDEKFFQCDVWGVRSTKFAWLWLEEFQKYRGGGQRPGLFVQPHLYPSSAGVHVIMQVLGYGAPVQPIVDFAHYPNLSAYMQATQGDPSKGSIVVPYVSSQDQQGGTVWKASTIAFMGVGLLGLFAIGIVFGAKKKRR